MIESIKFYLQHGANIEDRIENRNDLQYGVSVMALLLSVREEPFCMTKDREITRILNEFVLPLEEEKRKRILNVADSRGGGLLHHMALSGSFNSGKALIEAGADVNQLRMSWSMEEKGKLRRKNIEFKTPLDLAYEDLRFERYTGPGTL